MKKGGIGGNMYKLSNYIFIEKCQDDEFILLYNTFTSAFLRIPINLYPKVKKIFDNIENEGLCKNDTDLFKKLLQARFIVEKDYDEISFIRFRQQKMAHNNHQLQLTICPTLECNLGCVFCFEDRKKGKMGLKEIFSLKRLLESRAKLIRRFRVTWYGGEPLLYPEIIEELSKSFIKICKENDIFYEASMLTNGTLIEKLDRKFFEKNGISYINVNIDGPKHIHNQVRHMKNGEGSFDKIIRGIEHIKDTKVNISIRVEIGKINADNMDEMFKSFDSFKENFNHNIGIYFQKIGSGNTGPGCSYKCSVLSNKEYSDLEIKFNEYILNKYSMTSMFNNLNVLHSACHLTSISSYVVDPKCDLYKCWEYSGVEKYKVGTIDESGSIKITNYPFFLKCTLFDVTEYEKCRKCKFLPVCMGNCPMQFIEKGSTTMSACNTIKYNFSEKMKQEYRKNQRFSKSN